MKRLVVGKWSHVAVARTSSVLACILVFTCVMSSLADHGPEYHYHPFSRKKNGDLNHKWFPVGWAVAADDVGLASDPTRDPEEWPDGHVMHLVKQSECYWNCLYLIPISDEEEWGGGGSHPDEELTRSATFEWMLDSLKNIRDSTPTVDLRAFPCLTIRIATEEGHDVHPSGTWAGIPDGATDAFKEHVNKLENKPQLEGWILGDEPYGGIEADNKGLREYVYGRLCSWRDIIESEDTNSADHPIHTVLRGYGNYDDGDNPVPSDWLDDVDVGDYIHDDLYLDWYANYWNGGAGPWIGKATERTNHAIANIVEPGTSPAWLLWTQGSIIAGATNPSAGGTPHLTIEQVRYVNYAPWINGAQGTMFWNLTQSNRVDFEDRAQYIAREVYAASAYLTASTFVSDATITSTEGDDTAQFILRRNPNDSSKILLMLCNNSSEEADAVWVHFPPDVSITSVDQLVGWYNWSYVLYSYKIGLGMGPWTARAFILNVDED